MVYDTANAAINTRVFNVSKYDRPSARRKIKSLISVLPFLRLPTKFGRFMAEKSF
jgi:hypothetical protein